jgi:hypothetical protein
MSCIATIYLTDEEKYKEVIALSKNVKISQGGWWIFKKTVTIGKSEFERAFKDNFKDVETLQYSGYTMLEVEEIAQSNSRYGIPVETANDKDLERVFGYGGYVLRAKKEICIPEDDVIIHHLKGKKQDYRYEAIGAVKAAYNFYNMAASHVSGDNIVVIGLY